MVNTVNKQGTSNPLSQLCLQEFSMLHTGMEPKVHIDMRMRIPEGVCISGSCIPLTFDLAASKQEELPNSPFGRQV